MSWKIRRDDERYYVDANTMPGAQKALRLAAAAPDLLESVEALVDFIALVGSEGDPMQAELITKARAALAKAKGEQHE